jgi:hypothetical protein
VRSRAIGMGYELRTAPRVMTRGLRLELLEVGEDGDGCGFGEGLVLEAEAFERS